MNRHSRRAQLARSRPVLRTRIPQSTDLSPFGVALSDHVKTWTVGLPSRTERDLALARFGGAEYRSHFTVIGVGEVGIQFTGNDRFVDVIQKLFAKGSAS